MAKSNAGKWVSRVGAAGGGKSYKKSRPSNYYGALVVIVVLGLVLVVFSRYEYQHPTKAAKTPQAAPAIGSVLYASLAVDDCGTLLPYLTKDPTYKGSYQIGPDDVLVLSPVAADNAGKNATLANFTTEYPGLKLTTTKIAVPKSGGLANPATTFHTGDTCGAKTKYAGKKGVVEYAYWTTLGQTTPTITKDPAKIHFSKDLRVTIAFVPAGVAPLPPSTTTVDEMVLAATTPTTTTTAPTATTTTTIPTATTTTNGTTTTTKG